MAEEAYVVAIEGLEALQDFDSLSNEIKAAASKAVNAAVTRGRSLSAKRMMQQVNFPTNYLSGADGRLRIKQRASAKNLEAIIEGRFAPTSLARFGVSPSLKGQKALGGANVQVKPGQVKFMRRAFYIKLRRGAEISDTVYNLGLAIRLAPGETLKNKKNVKKLRKNVYLLYGPSVDQVFKDVAQDVSPEIEDFLEREFLRLLEVDNG